MALGPKAMGEAIVANLKTKTGKTLSEWQEMLKSQDITDEKTAQKYLKENGLGHFQAMTVAQLTFGQDEYQDEDKLVDELFADYPEQRNLYDTIVDELSNSLTVQPCKGYVPLYKDGKIIVSFKPTDDGLYAALNLTNPDNWQNSVEHKLSLGGSERLKDGLYVISNQLADQLVQELGDV